MIHDISPRLNASLAVWPGDTALSREVLLDIERGDTVTLSTLRATAHLGAHADAPSHYDPRGGSIAERPLERYLGPCRVLGVEVGRGGLVGPEHLVGPVSAERLLIRTNTYSDPSRFSEDFAALSPALVEWLADEGVKLLGIDTPSVDPFPSKDLPAHQACRRRDLAILEGLVLSAVPDGLYELIALPLRLEGFDASPVRAVLRTLGERETCE